MGSKGVPFPTSNNAPLPIPGGYGNPTGANTGFNFGSSTGQPFPTISPYTGFGGGGSIYGGTPGVGSGGVPFPSYNTGTYTGTNLGGMNAGILGGYQGLGKDLYDRLGKYYGRGAGQVLGDILSGKLYNPEVAAAFLNAQQPGIARGEAGVLGAFGDAGARFSSAAALGLGDYESQVQLNQQQTLAQMFEQAQSEELNVLQGLLPTLHAEKANQRGIGGKILGGAEIVGGAIMDYYTGGQGGNWLIKKGVNNLSGGSKGADPQMQPSSSPYGQPSQLPGWGGNTGTFGANAPSFGGSNADLMDWMNSGMMNEQMQADAAGIWQDIPGVTGQ